MTYMKPEMTTLGEAGKLIQSLQKTLSFGPDAVDPMSINKTDPAYDLDE